MVDSLYNNANGTNNSGGMIQHQVKLCLWIKGRTSTQNVFLLNLGGCDRGKGEVQIIGTPNPRHDEPEVSNTQGQPISIIPVSHLTVCNATIIACYETEIQQMKQ